MLDVLNTLIASPVVPLVILVVCLIDGFFPPIPSETAVVAAIAFALAQPVPNVSVIVAIGIAAAVGAALGDSIAYAVGRNVGTSRWRWMRHARVQQAVSWAGKQIARRPALLILTARYIPIGRVAVNMTAGATRLSYRKFLPLSVIAGATWAALSLLIATVASAWLGHSPLLAAALGVVISIALGVGVDLVSRLVQRRRGGRAADAACASKPDPGVVAVGATR